MSSDDMTTNDSASAELSLDDLEGAAGGSRHYYGVRNSRNLQEKHLQRLKNSQPATPQPATPQPATPDRMVFCVDCGASYMASQGHDCPDQ